MVSLRGLGRWQHWSKPFAPVTLLVAPKQCPDPTTTEQNKIWGWTNSCRISGSFIQIAHFPCFFLSLSPPPLDPRGRPRSQLKRSESERERDKQTNRGRDWVANMEELWHSWKGERERKKQLYWEWLWEGSCGQVWLSPLCLTDTRWQRFAAQLLSLPPILRSVIDSLLLNNRPSRVQCIYVTVCIWLVWERVVVAAVVVVEEERGTGWGAANPPWSPPLSFSLSTSPPPVPVLRSEPRLSGAGGAESGGRTEGEILLICVEFYYFQLFGSWWLPLSFPPSSSFPPCHANTGFPRTALSVCVPLCFLPFPVLPHPCLSRQLTFLTSATFLPVCSLLLCPSHFSLPHRAGW